MLSKQLKCQPPQLTLGKENLSHLDFLGLYYAGSKDCKRAFVFWVKADVLSLPS